MSNCEFGNCRKRAENKCAICEINICEDHTRTKRVTSAGLIGLMIKKKYCPDCLREVRIKRMDKEKKYRLLGTRY